MEVPGGGGSSTRTNRPPIPIFATWETRLWPAVDQARMVPFGESRREKRRTSFMVALGDWRRKHTLFLPNREGAKWAISLRLLIRIRAGLENHSPAKNLYWAPVSGTTESRPIRTRGESLKSLLDLISPKVTGLAIGFPALISTEGFLRSAASTETTEAVPTALLWSPVS